MALDNTELILRGFGQAAQGLSDYGARKQKEEELNRPVSPWVQAMLRREIDPEMAAAGERMGLPYPGAQQPASLASPQPQPQATPQQTAPQAAPVAPSGLAAQPAPPQPQQQPPALPPLTRRGLEEMAQAAPLLRAQNQLSPSDRFAIEMMKETGRDTRNQRNTTSREGIAGANREQRAGEFDVRAQQFKQQLDQRWQEAMLRARTLLQMTNTRGMTSRDIALMNVEQKQQSAALRATADTLRTNAYLLGDEAAKQFALQQAEQAEALANSLDENMKKARNQQAQPSQSTSIKSSTPGKVTPRSLNSLFGK